MRLSVFKKIFSIILVLTLVLNLRAFNFAQSLAGQEMRTQVLYLAGIIDNDYGMNENIKRCELAKMIIKSTENKDSVPNTAITSSFQDVPIEHEYASYINAVVKDKYMYSFLGGNFCPEYPVTYKELVRACITLLGYTNDDFKGNQTNGRYMLFCSLRMNDNIDRDLNDFVTKKDCVNALYNTLKTNKKTGQNYATSVFSKMKINSDGEINASGLLSTKLEGPFVLKREAEAFNLAIPFDVATANIFINGTSASMNEAMRELNNLGYLIYYYNKLTKTIYIYKEGISFESETLVKKGFINHIYYQASDTVTPTRVQIDLSDYTIGNSEMKFAFSYAGTLRVGDQIIFIYTKAQTNDDENDSGNIVTEGTITYACLYDINY